MRIFNDTFWFMVDLKKKKTLSWIVVHSLLCYLCTITMDPTWWKCPLVMKHQLGVFNFNHFSLILSLWFACVLLKARFAKLWFLVFFYKGVLKWGRSLEQNKVYTLFLRKQIIIHGFFFFFNNYINTLYTKSISSNIWGTDHIMPTC
jgi:hypothetical protein